MFRDANPSDRELFLAFAKEFYSTGAVTKPIDERNLSKTFNAAMEKSPFVRLLMFESDGSTIGYALLSFTYSNEAGGMVVLIEEVHVDENFRGGGVGSKFLKFLEDEYPDYKRFRLEVTAANKRAIALYEKFGYKLIDYLQMVRDR